MTGVAIVLSVILTLAIGVALLQVVNALFAQERQYNHRNYRRDLMIVDAVVLLLYLLLAGLIAMLYVAFRYDPLVLYLPIALLVAAAVALLLRHLYRHRDTLARGGMAAFLLWFGIVLYLTLFSRIGKVEQMQAVMTPFRGVAAAIRDRSLAPLEHSFLNVLLFVPFGFLIPCVNPRCLGRAGFALLGGIVASTLIEGLQMIFGIGFCDIDDIIANAIGAAVGYVLYRLHRQIQRNWRLI